MIKVSVSELKTFLGKASQIKENSIVPITKYIKLTCEGDVATLTKTNLQAFVVHQIEADFKKNFTVLLDEKTFTAAVSQSEGAVMKITFKDMKQDTPDGSVKIVTMEDGVYVNLKFQSSDENHFPAIPQYEKSDSYSLSPEMIESLYLASTSSLPVRGSVMAFQNYVHIRSMAKKKSYICGFNNTIMYFKSFGETLPDMVLDLNVCTTLAPYSESGVTFYKGEKYDFFDTGKTLFGFIQTELKGPDFHKIVEMKDDSKSFLVDRKSILSFCKLAISINPSSITEPCFFKNGESEKAVVFDYESAGYGVSNKVEVEVKKNKRHVVQKFLFNPHEMISLLKGLSFEQVNLVGPCSGNFYVTNEEDGDYIGAIREIVINNEQKQTQAE